MDRGDIGSIWNDIGWEEGRIPVVNAENKALQDEVFKLQHEIQEQKNILENVDEHMFLMSQHNKNVKQELQHTHQLLSAVSEEVNTEDHMMKICNGEKERLHQEEIRIGKECKNLKEKINFDENMKFKLNEEIEQLLNQMKMEKKELETWLEMTAVKEEDAITIQKYRRMDESKVVELNLQISNLTTEARNCKNTLDKEATETLTTQVALDKAAAEFRRSHQERHELINSWEHTLKMMNKRDKDMDSLNNQLQILKMEINKKKVELEKKKFFSQSEKENCKQLEDKIVVFEKESAEFRIKLQEAETQKNNFQDELDALKRVVDRTAADLEATRSQVATQKKTLMVETKKHATIIEQNAELVEKLQVVCECTMSAKENADQLEKMLKAEEKDQQNLNHELQELRSLKYQKEKGLVALQNELKSLEATVKNNQTCVRSLNNKISRLDQDALKQEGMLYNHDLMIETLNQRIARMEGKVNSDDMDKFKQKIEVLSQQLDEKNINHKMLEIQLNKLQDDIAKLEGFIKKLSTEMNTVSSKIDELELYNDNSDKLLKKLIIDNQKLMVKENLERLIAKRLRDVLYDKAYQVLSQEERKLQVETTMKERQEEINIHKDMLMAQIKYVNAERQEINMEYNERQAKIGKLQNRHEILMMSMAPFEEEEAKSQAYYVIKAAQEKEELQRIGDELDAKIRKTEKENLALNNTIEVLNTSNERFRTSFNRVSESSEEMSEIEQLEEKLRSVQEEIRHKRRQAKELTQDIQTMETTLENKIRENENLQEIMANKTKQLESAEKELDDLLIKIDRIKRQNARNISEIREAKQETSKTDEEVDIDLRGMINFNKSNITELTKIVQQFSAVAYENLLLCLSQANISVPTPTRTSRSGASSVRSATSSNASVSSIHSGISRGREAAQISYIGIGEDLVRDDTSNLSSLSGGSRFQRPGSGQTITSRRSSASSRSSRNSGQTQASVRSSASSFRK